MGEAAGLILLDSRGRVALAPGTARGLVGRCASDEIERRFRALFAASGPEGTEDAAVVLGTTGATEGSRRRRHAAHRSMSHDLRGALNTVALHVGLLREAVRETERDSDWDDRVRRYVEVLSGHQAELQRALGDMLDVTRPPGGDRSVFDLRDVCREAARLARWSARDAAEPTFDLPGEPVRVLDDRDAACQSIVEALLFVLDGADGGVCLRLESDGAAARIVVAAGEPGAPSTGWLQWPVAATEEVS